MPHAQSVLRLSKSTETNPFCPFTSLTTILLSPLSSNSFPSRFYTFLLSVSGTTRSTRTGPSVLTCRQEINMDERPSSKKPNRLANLEDTESTSEVENNRHNRDREHAEPETDRPGFRRSSADRRHSTLSDGPLPCSPGPWKSPQLNLACDMIHGTIGVHGK